MYPKVKCMYYNFCAMYKQIKLLSYSYFIVVEQYKDNIVYEEFELCTHLK